MSEHWEAFPNTERFEAWQKEHEDEYEIIYRKIDTYTYTKSDDYGESVQASDFVLHIIWRDKGD